MMLRGSNISQIMAVVAVYLFMYIPVIVLILFAFNDSPFIVFPISGLTLDWFSVVLTDKNILTALWNSLIVAFFVTILSVVLGTMGALAIIRYKFRMRFLLAALLFLPIIIPRTILGISFTTLQDFLDQSGNLTMVVLAQAVFCLPFAVIVISSVLWRFDRSLEEASLDLYAGRVRTFTKVTLPLIKNGIMAGALICMILSFSEYTLTWFASGHDQTLPLVIFAEYRYHLSPKINALSTLIVVANILIALAGEFIRSRGEKRLNNRVR